MGSQLAKPALDVGLVSSDAERLVRFYAEVVGFEPQPSRSFPGVGTIHKLACGHSTLRILQPETPPEPDDRDSLAARSGIRFLTLDVLDLDAAVQAVRACGGSVSRPPYEVVPGRRISQVADPDGNRIELGQG